MMELVIWGAGATGLGLLLGYVGYFHSKLAYSVFTTALGVIVFCSGYLVDLTGGDSAAVAQMQNEAGQVYGIGILKNIMSAIDTMGYLPFHVQVSILIFTFAFFGARIATWAGTSFGPAKPEETTADRKARVLASYGMKSMDDVRKLR